MAAAADRATFIVRLWREGEGLRWSGVIELVGSEVRRVVADAGDVAEFIEQTFLDDIDRLPAQRARRSGE